MYVCMYVCVCIVDIYVYILLVGMYLLKNM